MTDFPDNQISQKSLFLKDEAIIIFIKNPQLGKVKTRLAATVGDVRALEIYHILMQHTKAVTNDLSTEKYLFYSAFVDEQDIWENEKYHKSLQYEGQDLGMKMAVAFTETFQKNHSKVLIIGSDCLELNQEIIKKGYEQLSHNEVVIGPANDGGYYLIGFNFNRIGVRAEKVLKEFFVDKEWSHERVFQEAIEVCQQQNLGYFELPTLTDVDEEKDYLKTQHLAMRLS